MRTCTDPHIMRPALCHRRDHLFETTSELDKSNGAVQQDKDDDEADSDEEEEEAALWQDEQERNGEQLCRICTSADGEIPMSALPPHILNSNIRRRLVAIYHATSHQETSSLKYMKSEKQSSRQQVQSQGMMSSGVELPSQDVSAGLSGLEEQFIALSND